MATAAPELISIVVPVYDSPDPVALVDRIDAAFAGRSERHEVILVDDDSPSARVWPQLERLAAERPHVHALQLTRNFGQQAATLCGLAQAQGARVVTLDDDLQHDPAEIATLLEAPIHDIVIGELRRSEHRWWRRLASHIKGRFDEIVVGKPKGLRLSSFRLLSRTVVDGMLSLRVPDPFLPALMFRVSRDAFGVPVSHSPRAAGRSGYTPRKLVRVFAALLINNSSLLLRAAAASGLAFAALSVGLAGLAVWRKLSDGAAVTGWTSLFAAVMLIGGLTLTCLGVVGEYLIRIIESSEQRPPYFVRRRVD